MLKTKKILSIILALAMILSSVSVLMSLSVSADTLDIWDGTSDSSLEGSGTSADPYLITTPEEFNYAIRKHANNAYYKLTTDIYLNDITKIDWSTGTPVAGYTPNVWDAPQDACGYYDGNGHIVYGIYCDENPESYSEKNSASKKYGYGLVGMNYSGRVLQFNNLGLDNIYIHAPHEVSPFVANQNGGTMNFYSCFVGENVHLEGYAVGGFVGYGSNSKITIEDCYCVIPTANVTVHDGKSYGAILGNTWNSTNKPNIKYNFCVGKLFANSSPNSADYTYETVNDKGSWGTTSEKVHIITEEQMKGADALNNMSQLHTSKFVTTDSFPQLKIFVSTPVTYHKTPTSSEVLLVNGEETIADLEIPQRSDYELAGIFYDSAYTEEAESTDILADHSDIYLKWTRKANANIWDGTKETPMYGAGTETDPYLIYSPQEFAFAVTSYKDNTHPYFQLQNDIYLNDVSSANWKENSPRSWYTNSETAFVGTLDGNNHIVYGMYYNNPGNSNVSLIPKYQGGTVKNIGIKNAYVNGNNVGGILTASTWYGEKVIIDNCFVDSDVTLIGANNAGGIASHVTKSGSNYEINNCYSIANVSNANCVGGIIGDAYSISSCKVTDCYSTISICGRSSASGITPSNCYDVNTTGVDWGNITDLTAAQMQGATALVNMPKLDTDYFVAKPSGYPVLKSFNNDNIVTYYVTSDISTELAVSDTTTFADIAASAVAGYLFNGFYKDAGFTQKANNTDVITTDFYAKWAADANDNHAWDGTKKAPILGAGTEANPYKIYTPEELAYAVTSGEGYFFKLQKDIFVNNVTLDTWTDNAKAWMNSTDSAFVGNIDGNGKIVYGLYFDDSSKNVALIPQFRGGKVSNLGIKKAYLNGQNVGGIMVDPSSQTSTVTIENCFVDTDVTLIGSRFAGGIISHSSLGGASYVINNCYSLANITTTAATAKDGTAGGIIGNSWGSGGFSIKINNCYSTISISGRAEGGGITAKNCYEITSTGVTFKNVTQLAENNMKGKDVLSSSNKMTNLNSASAYFATEGYPQLLKFRTGDPTVTATCIIKNNTNRVYNVYDDTTMQELGAPVRYGYDFVGFYSDANFVNAISGSDLVSDHATFYSKWKLSPIEEFSNTFDDHQFEDIDLDNKATDRIDDSGKTTFTGSTIDTGAAFANNTASFSQYDAVVTNGGVNSSKCVKFDFAISYRNRWPAAFLLYDENGDAFVPNPNTTYKITLKYKVNKTAEDGSYAKNLNLVLRSVGTSGQADPKAAIEAQSTAAYDLGNGVYQYGKFNENAIQRGAVTDGWVTEDLIFTTGDSTRALFIALVADYGDNANYFAKDLDVRVDDINIQTCSVPAGMEAGDVNGDDFTNVLDLVALKKMSANQIAKTWGADVNGDKNLANSADLTVLVNILLGIEIEVQPQEVLTKMGRTLVWSDEFDGDNLNTEYWGFRRTMKQHTKNGIATGEDDDLIYDNTKAHANVAGGNLDLHISKADSGKYILAEGISTRGKMSFNHGYLEIRAKLPQGQGMWPSLWLQAYDAYGFERNVDYNPEIDIFEIFSGSNTLRANLIKHYPNGDSDSIDADKSNLKYTASINDGKFHTYGFEWTSTEMKLYVDDVLKTTIKLSDSGSSSIWSWFNKDKKFFGKSGEINHFADTFFSININHEIFNSAYTSTSDGNWAYKSGYTIKSTDALPDYVIDYVRLYQKSGEHMSLDQQTLAR